MGFRYVYRRPWERWPRRKNRKYSQVPALDPSLLIPQAQGKCKGEKLRSFWPRKRWRRPKIKRLPYDVALYLEFPSGKAKGEKLRSFWGGKRHPLRKGRKNKRLPFIAGVTYNVALDGGTYAITGNAATFAENFSALSRKRKRWERRKRFRKLRRKLFPSGLQVYSVALGGGSYAITGNAATFAENFFAIGRKRKRWERKRRFRRLRRKLLPSLPQTYNVSLGGGSYAITGNAATFVKTVPAQVGYRRRRWKRQRWFPSGGWSYGGTVYSRFSFLAETGVYTITGNAATFSATIQVRAFGKRKRWRRPRWFPLVGWSNFGGVVSAYPIILGGGSYNITGNDATFGGVIIQKSATKRRRWKRPKWFPLVQWSTYGGVLAANVFTLGGGTYNITGNSATFGGVIIQKIGAKRKRWRRLKWFPFVTGRYSGSVPGLVTPINWSLDSGSYNITGYEASFAKSPPAVGIQTTTVLWSRGRQNWFPFTEWTYSSGYAGAPTFFLDAGTYNITGNEALFTTPPTGIYIQTSTVLWSRGRSSWFPWPGWSYGSGAPGAPVWLLGGGTYFLTGNPASFQVTLAPVIGIQTAPVNWKRTARWFTRVKPKRLGQFPKAFGFLGSGSYLVTGNAASFNFKRSFVGNTGTYLITGNAARFGHGWLEGTGSYLITGTSATFTASLGLGSLKHKRLRWRRWNRKKYHPRLRSKKRFGYVLPAGVIRSFNADGGSYLITGNAATFGRRLIWSFAGGSYLITGVDANFTFRIAGQIIGRPTSLSSPGGGGFYPEEGDEDAALYPFREALRRREVARNRAERELARAKEDRIALADRPKAKTRAGREAVRLEEAALDRTIKQQTELVRRLDDEIFIDEKRLREAEEKLREQRYYEDVAERLAAHLRRQDEAVEAPPEPAEPDLTHYRDFQVSRLQQARPPLDEEGLRRQRQEDDDFVISMLLDL